MQADMDAAGVEQEKVEPTIPDKGQSSDENETGKTQEGTIDVEKVKKDVHHYLFHKFDISALVNPNKPWVIEPNGSFRGYFDFVPIQYRVGPWRTFSVLLLTTGIYFLLIATVYVLDSYDYYCFGDDDDKTHDTRLIYYEAYTTQWYCNLFGLLWTIFVFDNTIRCGFGLIALGTYTVQSWTLIMIRFFLGTIIPFFPYQKFIHLNEFFRLPALTQPLATFVIWNFILAPAVFFFRLKTEEDRKKFVGYFTNFRLTQLHVFNLPIAAMAGIWGTPMRELTFVDLYASGLCQFEYIMLYLFVFDRVGVHFYYIFSPRTKLFNYSAPGGIILTVLFYFLWRRVILAYGDSNPFEYFFPSMAETA